MALAITRPRCNILDQISNSQHHQVAGKKGVNGDPPRALTKQRWVGARKTGLGGEAGHQRRAPEPHSELPESRWRSEQTLVLLSEAEPFAQRLGGFLGPETPSGDKPEDRAGRFPAGAASSTKSLSVLPRGWWSVCLLSPGRCPYTGAM